MEDIGIFYGHSEYFVAILVYLKATCYIFFHFGMLCQENLATLVLLHILYLAACVTMKQNL
jgi:hypothetical protein